MLRADPPTGIDIPTPQSHPLDTKEDHYRGTPFPTSPFSFSTPYESLFDFPGSHGTAGHVSSSLPSQKDYPPSSLHFPDSIRGPLDDTHSPPGGSVEGLSPAAAASAASIAESYAQFNMNNMNYEDYQLMNMMYNNGGSDYGHGMGPNSFTVDPTQILPNVPLDPGEAFHPSPSSDGWGNGVGSSSNASPEPYNVSNASTPPSIEGAPGGSRPTQTRKIASTKRVTQDAANRAAGGSGAQRKGSVLSNPVIRPYEASSPRSPVPPSSFPSGLQPVASRDANGSGRRLSRTELDFETALRTGGTVILNEAFDVDGLGADPSNSSITLSAPPSPLAQRGARGGPRQPATPTVSPDYQTRRRSMYRSPGTASSPDLATLLRKAKERGGGAPVALSPASSVHATPGQKGKMRSSQNLSAPRDPGGAQSPEWVLASPRPFGTVKRSSKNSVRAKTSAFLGKMLGTSSARERSRTLTSSPSTTSIASYSNSPLFDAFPLLCPRCPRTPLGCMYRALWIRGTCFPSPPGARTRSRSLPSSRRPSTDSGDFSDDQSVVLVAAPSGSRSRTPSPTRTVKERPGRHVKTPSRGSKRRSMSVSDVEIKKIMGAGAGASPSPLRMSADGKMHEGSPGWGSRLEGIMSQFRGSCSSSTRPVPRTVRPHPKSAASLPVDLGTPAVTLQTTTGGEENLVNAGPSSPSAAPRLGNLRYGPRSPPPVRGSAIAATTREGNRLRVQHRSTASASEPSLVPERDEPRTREQLRTVRSSLIDPKVAGLSASSQLDLSTADLVPNRYPLRHSSSPARTDEGGDLETRAKDLATRCWVEDEEFLPKDKIAEWLGGQSIINKTALRHYMDNFDFSGLRLDQAFRHLCAKLYLKAETQQVDRILEVFAKRYWDCNPTTLFGNSSVVHAVSYSILLLNTDLHVAEMSNRMSRNQFVRNTMTTVQIQLQPSGMASSTDLTHDDWSSIRGGSEHGDVPGATVRARAKRSDSITSWSSVTRDAMIPSSGTLVNSSGQLTLASDPIGSSSANQSSVSVGGSSNPDGKQSQDAGSLPPPSAYPANGVAAAGFVYDRNWEADMENMLKDMYNAVKAQQILLPIANALMARSSTSSLSPHGTMLRNRSVRVQPDRLMTLKRGSIRGLQSLMGTQNHSPYSSGSSIDGRASPAPSFATSNDGLGASTLSFMTPAMGFASNLSHTIIREQREDDEHSLRSDDTSTTDISISDEELALLGPPWAKEGMLCRKQYWDSAGKRAKSKTWMDAFVVIQKGELSMFTFGDNGLGGAGVVGGGNWLENATPVGVIVLAHSLAHALPPPGYNRQRPHCMVLTLSNGGVYFFQAGTEELVNEWVSTCNYWAARQSKEPLVGGVSNMEYGWNRVVEPVARVRSVSEDDYSSFRDTDNQSVRSGRSRFKDMAATVRAEKSPWADRTFINDWKPPLPPSVPSQHDEETQLEALQKHVAHMKEDLQQHNELRQPMMNLYQPRSANAQKATTNWEKKSQYLLTEIVKYDSYIDSLQAAMALRLKKRGEKALEKALRPDDASIPKAKWKGQPEEDTIEEGEEPPPSAGFKLSPVSMSHRREVASGGDGDGTDES
ncbi:uncharacterized protein BXZ73DRAFT_90208 [Epithele typhae]|uniref:uncharacterized protein n=1 Tax=Epithele typhae TaxID=378194 RepID=UPI00200833ED|nr:uncharacterized protein BXZ73DRAFT_90208 [Epithele typhae]KAH9931131.1 hypothetical protein BXZ73DRAFT_90208 [Epithele typhae]